MKEKILLIIIFILLTSIVYINFFNNKDNLNKTGKVLGAFDNEKINFDLSSHISNIPTKSDAFYEDDYIYAQNYILIDASTGTILAAKNEHEKVSVASTTKIMTAIIALENFKLDDSVTIQDRTISSEESCIGLVAGDKLTVEDLLKALLISSANDAAYALADHMGYEKFVSSMNDKLKYLGLNNSYFVDPAGFSDDGKSSAYDLAYMTKYAMLNEKFKDIVKTEHTDIVSANSILYDLKNSNRLIKQNELLYYPYATGVKTGFTYEAGHCLVSTANKNNHEVISVVLKTDADTNEASAEESKKLLEYGYDNYIWQY